MDINNIGKRVLSIRQRKNLSQAKFAEFANLGQSYVAAVEIGRKKPSLNFIVSVLDATKVSVDWLFTGKGSMYPQIKKEKQEIKEINEYRVDYGTDNSPGLDDELNDLKSHWSKLNDAQKRALMVVLKEMVKNNNEILMKENRMLKDFIIKLATNQHGEMPAIPSNVVQGLTD
ncbi:MAG: helix-turn-helix transcriptional regulator [Pseudomonadota bacterium]